LPKAVLRQNEIRVKIGLIPTCERSSEWFPGRVGRFTATHDDERVAARFTTGKLAHLYHQSLLFVEHWNPALGGQIIAVMKAAEPWQG
jgi:hypothetical protein